MIFARSAASAKPPKITPMLLPGSTASGLVIHLSSVASSQVMPEPLTEFGVRKARFGSGLAAHHAVEAGPKSVVVLHEGMALAAVTVECKF